MVYDFSCDQNFRKNFQTYGGSDDESVWIIDPHKIIAKIISL